jgi:hypothetical protein
VQQGLVETGERDRRGLGGECEDHDDNQEDEGGAFQRPGDPDRLTPAPPARSSSR